MADWGNHFRYLNSGTYLAVTSLPGVCVCVCVCVRGKKRRWEDQNFKNESYSSWCWL